MRCNQILQTLGFIDLHAEIQEKVVVTLQCQTDSNVCSVPTVPNMY